MTMTISDGVLAFDIGPCELTVLLLAFCFLAYLLIACRKP